MIKVLAPRGIRIPDGFALTAGAFRRHLKEAGLFDGFSIGSIDLTQLALGIDRRVGSCGQAPSDYEFAEYLASIGIDSISLNPDSLAEVAMRLAAGPEEC